MSICAYLLFLLFNKGFPYLLEAHLSKDPGALALVGASLQVSTQRQVTSTSLQMNKGSGTVAIPWGPIAIPWEFNIYINIHIYIYVYIYIYRELPP